MNYQKFQFTGSVNEMAQTSIEFIDGEVIHSVLGKKQFTASFEDITKVEISAVGISMGRSIKFRMYAVSNGKEIKTHWIQVETADRGVAFFFDSLKGVTSPNVVWQDNRTVQTDSSGKKSFDLVFKNMLTKIGGGGTDKLSRGLAIGIYSIVGLALFFLIFPPIYFAKLLFGGGYRVYTDEQGMEIRYFSSKKLTWSSIRSVQVSGKSQVIKFHVTSSEGNHSLEMLANHGVPFMKELATHGLVDDQTLSQFV